MSIASQTLKEFLAAISQFDTDKVISLFAPDVVQSVPFAPEGSPKRIEGKEAVSQNFQGLPLMFRSMDYQDVEIVETADDNFAIGFAHAEAELVNGEPYQQDYVFYVRLENGLIKDYREYMNPQPLAAALAQLFES